MTKGCFILCFIMAGLMLLVSCTKLIVNAPSADEIVIFPSPPDPPRIQFLTSISSSKDITGSQSGFNKFILGEDQPKPIIKPYGITVNKGKLYICDAGAGGLEIIDLINNKFDYFTPSGMGRLKLPINCYVDEQENLFVADGNRRQIVVFDKEGKYVDAFGDTEDYKPTGVFIYDGKIWVANVDNHRIHVYDKQNYEFLYSFPDTDQEDNGYLYQPINIYLAKDRVYVSDFGDFKIKIYSLDGEFLESIGSYGRNFGQFARPKGIAVDRDSNLYVVDAAFENAQIFNGQGDLLMFFGGPYKGPGNMWLPAGIAIDYGLLGYFRPFVNERFELIYLIFVTNQYGPDKVSVYGYVKSR